MIRIYFTLILTLLLRNVAFSQSVSFDKKLKIAKEQNKMLLVYIKLPEVESFMPLGFPAFDDPCAFAREECHQELDSLFIIMPIEIGGEEHKWFISHYDEPLSPTFAIISSSGELLFSSSGFKLGVKFIREDLLLALQENKELRRIREFKESTIKDKDLSGSLLKYINKIGYYDRNLFLKHIKSLEDIDFKNSETFTLLIENLQFMTTKEEQGAIEKLCKINVDISNHVEKFRLDSLLKTVRRIAISSLSYTSKINNHILAEEVFRELENNNHYNSKYSSNLTPENTLRQDIFILQIFYYLHLKDESKLFKVSKELANEIANQIKTVDTSDTLSLQSLVVGLNTLSWNFCELKTQNADILTQIENWSNKSIELDKVNPVYYDTKAHILYLQGKKTEAIELQEYALKLVNNLSDEDYTKEILKSDIEKNLKKFKEGDY
jgi:hypothetical protein